MRDELLGIPHADEDFLVPGVDHAAPRRGARAPRTRGGHGGARPARRRAAPSARSLGPGARARGDRADAAARRAQHRTGAPGLRDRRRPLDHDRRGHGATRLHGQRDGEAVVDRRPRRPVRRPRRPRAPGGCGRSRRGASPRIRCACSARSGSSPSWGSSVPEETLEQMSAEAPGLANVSAERIGGGLAADGMGELSRLLMGRRPATALALARDTGVLQQRPAGARTDDRLPARQRPSAAAARRAPVRRRPGDGRRRRRHSPSGWPRCCTTWRSPSPGPRASPRSARREGGRTRPSTPPLPGAAPAPRSSISRGHGFNLDGDDRRRDGPSRSWPTTASTKPRELLAPQARGPRSRRTSPPRSTRRSRLVVLVAEQAAARTGSATSRSTARPDRASGSRRARSSARVLQSSSTRWSRIRRATPARPLLERARELE